MGVCHAAVALGAARAVPRLNVGWLIFAALLADLLLGICALLGLEHASVPANFSSGHYLTFTFPYSHGLLPLLLWAVIAGFLISLFHRSNRKRIFIVIAGLVLSHFVLDALVHVAGLPLAGENSPKIGLALWNHMGLELVLETLMAVGGVMMYLKVAGARSPRVSRWGITIFVAFLTALTWTQLFSTKPPQPAQLIPGWIVAPLVLSAVAYYLDRKRVALAADQAYPAKVGRGLA
jgi:hypothetical protein